MHFSESADFVRGQVTTRKVAPGTTFDLPIILMCDIRQGKVVKIREHFDLLTLLEPDTPHRLYS